jgi:hypothetical protein
VHLAVSGEPEPVAASGQLPDVADRPASHALGQGKGLSDGEDRTLGGVLVIRAFDPARVAGNDLVVLGRGHQHRPQKPVGLRRRRRGRAVADQGPSESPT